jgi:hypothetical protein
MGACVCVCVNIDTWSVEGEKVPPTPCLDFYLELYVTAHLKGAIILYANRAMHILLVLSDKRHIQQHLQANELRGPAIPALSDIFTSQRSLLMCSPPSNVSGLSSIILSH